MKIIRNIARRPWPRIGGWLPVMMLICGVLASCSSEDESTAPLPDGKYPLQLTAEVAQPQTRAGGKDAWTGGEEIRVSLEGVFGNKTYVMDASGNASPKDADNAFYWKNTDEARVSAWTPDIESETDISDQSGGYAAFDVLYASAIGRYDQAINLRFIHRENRSNSQSWRRHYGRGVGGCDRHHFRRPANALNRRLGITG